MLTWSIRIYDYEKDKIVCFNIDELSILLAVSNMPYFFPKEAMKAQIIISRTFLAKKIKALGGEGCSLHKNADICKSAHCMNFLWKTELFAQWGKEAEEKWQYLLGLAEETENKIIEIDHKPIMPFFHKACGGSTENSENVNGEPFSYLRKTFCDYCKETIEDIKNIDLNIDEIEKKLETNTLGLNWKNGSEIKGLLESVERDDQGRIRSIKIGNNIYKGQEIADKLGLYSNRFGWKPKVITFESKGEGSGLGLCQYGAKEMAREGKSAEQIIKYYYTGIALGSLKKYDASKPLSGRKLLLDPGNGAKKANRYLGRKSMLSICILLKEKLDILGADVYLTRKANEFCPIQEKIKKSEELNPDFYIEINCNYAKNASFSGTEIFHFRGDEESSLLAKKMIANLSKSTNLVQKGTRVAELSLFKEIKKNALLIELGYISNKYDRFIFKNEKEKNDICDAVVNGIKEFYLEA